MKALIKEGLLADARTPETRPVDILICDGIVARIAPDISDSEAEIIDAWGKLVAPGLVDVHVHFREPGQEHKEDIRSGSRAAAAGGFTAVVAEPNTLPPIDTPARLRRLLKIAREKSVVRFYTKAAITMGQNGEKLTDIAGLKRAGARAASDDGHPVPTGTLMQHAIEKCRECGVMVSPHCEESPRDRNKLETQRARKSRDQAQDGGFYLRAGGIPYTSEDRLIRRDIELAEKVGARIHISHVSLAKSVKIIAAAKKRGVMVTAEAAPHHFLLTDADARRIGPNAKANPPLRSRNDVDAVRHGLRDGTIDVIACDHAPHSLEEKNRSWDDAPFGVIGLETTLGLVLTYLVRPGILTLAQAIEKMTIAPARIFGLDADGIGVLSPGSPADITIIDPDRKWKVDPNKFQSKSRNCPFDGWNLQGKAALTIVGGKIVARDGKIIV